MSSWRRAHRGGRSAGGSTHGIPARLQFPHGDLRSQRTFLDRQTKQLLALRGGAGEIALRDGAEECVSPLRAEVALFSDMDFATSGLDIIILASADRESLEIQQSVLGDANHSKHQNMA